MSGYGRYLLLPSVTQMTPLIILWRFGFSYYSYMCTKWVFCCIFALLNKFHWYFSAIGGSRLEKCILVRSSWEFFQGGWCDYSLLCYIVLVWSSFFVDLLCFCKLRLSCQFLIFRGVDHQWDGNLFATAGAQVDIWDHNRFQSPLSFLFPLNSFLK